MKNSLTHFLTLLVFINLSLFIVPATHAADTVLDFTWTYTVGDNMPADGNFSYSGKVGDAINAWSDSWVGFNGNVTATSRNTYSLVAGTHTFALRIQWRNENRDNCNVPKIQLNSEAAVTHAQVNLVNGVPQDVTYSVTVPSNGDYTIRVISQDGDRDKFGIRSLTIPESAFLPACTAPNHVDVSGIWHFFPGETLSLTATAYSSAGTSDPIDAADITSYQWQKYIGSTWTDIDGATSATYTKTNATTSDVGHYRCIASTGAGCSTTSSQFDVKCLQLYLYWDDNSDKGNLALTKVDATHATATIFLENGSYTYHFKLTDGCEDWYGNSGTMNSSNCSNWTMDVNAYCGLTTTKAATYIFSIEYSDFSHPQVSVTYPSSNQAGDIDVYFANDVRNWDAAKIFYRIGTSSANQNALMSKVNGTANLFHATTISLNGFDAWHISENCGWSGSNSVYLTKTVDSYAITQATRFEGAAIPAGGWTIVPGNDHTTGGDSQNNNCEFYSFTTVPGMWTHNVSIVPPSYGTLTVNYTSPSNAGLAFNSGSRDLAHTCYCYVTAEEGTGYTLATLTVNGNPIANRAYFILTEDAVVEATFTPAVYTVTLHTNGGTINSGNVTSYTYGVGATLPTDVTLAGYRLEGWYDNSGCTGSAITAISTSETGNKEFWANWIIDNCVNTKTIQCEDYNPSISKPSVGHDKPSSYAIGGNGDGYGVAMNDAFADFKSSGSDKEIYFDVSLPAGEYTFTVRCSNGGQKKVVLYNAAGDTKLQELALGSEWDNNQWHSYTTSSWTSASSDYYYIGLRAEGNYAAFDQIVITASTNVFCPDLTYTINSLPWSDSGKDLTEGVVVSNVALSCFDTQITFTFSGAGTVQYYANNDRTTPLGTLTSGTPLALTDALRTYGIYIESTGAATLTAVNKTTVGHVYNIWTGSCSVSADYTGVNELGTTVTILASLQPSEWLQQVVLGPEHFQTAQVGDTLRVSYESGTIGSEPKGAIQTADNYASLLGNIYDNSNGALISTNETRTFDLPTYGYYHLITAGSLAQLQTKGIVVKGRVHTITGVSLHAACGNTTLRTSAPDITHVVKDDGRGTDIMVAPIEFDPRFALGNWEHKLWVDHTCFANVTVGTVINFYMQVHPDSTISFRCNVPDIIADDKTGGVGCPSYGDISFDRTIDSLYGHGPKTVGSIIDYRVMWLVVDADMLRRLNETGLIVCGKNCEISKVWAISSPIIVYPGENKTVPTVVNCIEIYQGGEVANTEDVKVLGTITYHRPTHDDGTSGKLGNKLDQWYTFTLPFTVDSSQVYDVTDARWWDINAVYYTTDGAQPENNPNPTGAGHYYLQWLKSDGENTGVEEVFRARWQYINPSHSLYLRAADYDAIDVKRYGYPMRDSAYIILYDTQKPLGSNYFNANYQVRFMGGPQTIEGVAKQWKVNASGNQFWLYANNTLHSFTFSGSAYVLDAQGEYFVLQDNPTIRPFECYVQATDSYKRKCSYISILGSHNSATGIEIVDPDDTQCTKVLRDGKLFIIRNNRWYDATGSRVR